MAAQALTITKLQTISARMGAASFSDGAEYGYFIEPIEGQVFFSDYRKREGTWERFNFTSPKRAKLIEAALAREAVPTYEADSLYNCNA